MDPPFRIGVGIGGIVLIAVITYTRFCGSLSVPPKPPPLAAATGAQRQLLARSTTSPSAYLDDLARDAASAGVRTPTLEEMSRKLVYRVDDARHVLEPGAPAIEVAGLRLRAVHSGDAITLVIENLTRSDLGYEVTTDLGVGAETCDSVSPLPFDAMVIAKGATETRTECAWKNGIAVAVTKVETVEVGPLSSYYLSEVPPSLVGLDERIARGNRGVESDEPCSAVMPAAVSASIERGDIGWRDLVDFYARHRCQTFEFPITYRAFKSDGERTLPALN